jgi:hypothetical protein
MASAKLAEGEELGSNLLRREPTRMVVLNGLSL